MKRSIVILFIFATSLEAKDCVRTRAMHKQRSSHEIHMFKLLTGYPSGREGFQIDHITPIKRGGLDVWWNMQWLETRAKYLKDRWE